MSTHCLQLPIDDFPITPAELINEYLFGINLTANGCPFPDALFENAIRVATAVAERDLGIAILPIEFYAGEDGSSAVTRLSNQLDAQGRYGAERHDFNTNNAWSIFRVNFRPLRAKPSRVRLFFRGNPSPVFTFTEQWIDVKDANSGRVTLLAPSNSPLNVITESAYTQLALAARYGVRQVPDYMFVDYKAGFERGCVPADIRHLIAMIASIIVLDQAGDLILATAGIANYSLSLGGLSQSVGTTSSATNAGYGARILSYQKQMKTLIPQIRAQFVGFGLAVI